MISHTKWNVKYGIAILWIFCLLLKLPPLAIQPKLRGVVPASMVELAAGVSLIRGGGAGFVINGLPRLVYALFRELVCNWLFNTPARGQKEAKKEIRAQYLVKVLLGISQRTVFWYICEQIGDMEDGESTFLNIIEQKLWEERNIPGRIRYSPAPWGKQVLPRCEVITCHRMDPALAAWCGQLLHNFSCNRNRNRDVVLFSCPEQL